MTAPQRTKVFISYSHKDEEYRKRLEVHLKPQENAGLVDRWDDTRLKTGQRWQEEIQKALAASKVAVLLISADFLASDFIEKYELPSILAAEREEGLIVMPVILKPSAFDDLPLLSQFQSINPSNQPMIDLSEGQREAFWVQLARDIGDALKPNP